MVHLQEFLTLPEHTLVYVFDSHRPLNLHNMFGSQQVWFRNQVIVVDDGKIDNLRELKKAFEELEFEDSEEESESDDDDLDDESEKEGDEDEDIESASHVWSVNIGLEA